MTHTEFTRSVMEAIGHVVAVPCASPLDCALKLLPADATALEFGVYKGATLGRIACAIPRGSAIGFDSFEGLPTDWRPGFPAGSFALDDLSTVIVLANAQIIIGLFADTLPKWVAEHPEPVALVHIDCDIYESSACVLELMADRITPATVLVFDELVNYPGFEDHEMRALWEHCERHALSPRIICAGGIYGQAVSMTLGPA